MSNDLSLATYPGRTEMLELLAQRAAQTSPKDVQQTAEGRWPVCIGNLASAE
jgi:hypothetical protein